MLKISDDENEVKVVKAYKFVEGAKCIGYNHDCNHSCEDYPCGQYQQPRKDGKVGGFKEIKQ